MEENKDIQEQSVSVKDAVGGKVPDNMQKMLDQYTMVVDTILHGRDNRDNVMDLLSSGGEPAMSVPNAAILLNDQGVKMTDNKVPIEVQLGTSIHLVTDLIELGQAGLGWEVSNEEMQAIYQDTLQDYIGRGLKDGSVDVMELQQTVEPLMNEEQKAAGLKAGEATGVSAQPNIHGAIAQLKRQGGNL